MVSKFGPILETRVIKRKGKQFAAGFARFQNREDADRMCIYIYMEYCSGGDLATYIKRHKMQRSYISESVIWSVLIQLLDALHYCHSHKPKRIMHRDIKPGNIMMNEAKRIKLGDFGLARELGQYSLAKTNVGTPLYMSPEQIDRRPYNDKCDIWALGCVMYELAALVPPFEAQTQAALNLKIKSGRYNALPETYSSELKGVITSMLEMRQSARPDVAKLMEHPRVMAYRQKTNAPAPSPTDAPKLMEARDRDMCPKCKALFAQRERDLKRREDECARREMEISRARARLDDREKNRGLYRMK
ncbi:hypothetical protein KIPB_009708 [Kipferlia bialata]|uniref:non-specific serine/threonine protein kinase n=1 Tax=Kipferlia bialata TaxID=797122 RepID=A0A9K3GMG6_9EUKA|nr:hypothetical protein KIPB_009708 [Kipferlia bialata]|eukprot:g9708.t1